MRASWLATRTQSTPPTPVCYIASSASILTKRGVGTPYLAVILAWLPFDRVQLQGSHRCRGVRLFLGRSNVLCHGGEVPPARSGSSAGDPSDKPENRLDLLPGAACNVGLEGEDSCLVPLDSPATRHKRGLVEGGKEKLELPP